MKSNRDNLIGTRYKTNEGYEIEIIDYINKNNVLIKFLDDNNYQVWNTMQNIRNGQIKNPYHKSVYNRGFYGVGEYTSRINNKKTDQYIKWMSIFVRCYDKKYLEKESTYEKCEVSDEFCNFQNFAQWYDRAIYNCDYPLALDKDFLIKDNKIYKPGVCCFLPQEINSNLNYTRSNPEYMKYYYEKYKDSVPSYIAQKLYRLSKGEE